MPSGAEQYAASEQLIALGLAENNALAIRAGEARAMLALAASNIAVAMQNKPAATTATSDMQAWVKATASTGALPAITVDDDGVLQVAANLLTAATTKSS